MAATIKIKNSSTASAVPTSSDLVQGELAVNVTDKRIYTENASGTVVELGTNPSTLTVAADATINGIKVGQGAGSVSSNTAVGASALNSNTTGLQNTAVGQIAMRDTTTGQENTAIGRGAAYQNTTGSQNSVLGTLALQSNTTGTNNISIGQGSGGTLTTGSYNTYIGINANASGTAVSGELVISADSSAVGKGSNTGFIKPGGSGVYQGNNSASWSTTSDRRLKKNIVDFNVGLEKITAIQVRNFEYRLPEEVEELSPNDAIQKEGVQLGVIAQEIQQVLPECVKQESTGVLSVDPDSLTWYMVNAIKELKAEFDAYKEAHP